MQPIAKAEAQTLLEPYMEELCAPVHAAWRLWDKKTPLERQALTPRTRANWIFDQEVSYAKPTLDRPPVFTLTEQPGFLVVTVEDRVALRYKKLNEELGICGIGTDQFKLWGAQNPLEGMEALTHLVIGYQVTELGTLGDIKIVCSQGRRVIWDLDAPRPAAEVTRIPTSNEPPAPKITPLRQPAEAPASSDS